MSTPTVFATTREHRARELANLARWERDQAIEAAARRLEAALRDSARFALSQSTAPGQKAGDRLWHRLLVDAHLASYAAEVEAIEAAARRLEAALRDSARFALSQSTAPGQKAGDRLWHRLLVDAHLASYAAEVEAIEAFYLTQIGADQ